MSRARLGILTASAIALLGLALFDPWMRSPTPQNVSLVPLDIFPSTHGLLIEQNLSSYDLFLGDDGWQLRTPVSAPANQEAIRQIFEVMQLLRSRRRAVREVAGDTVLRITLSGAAGPFVLMVGGATADLQHRWVRTSASTAAHLVEAHLIDELHAAMDSLASRRLVGFDLHTSETLRLSDGEVQIEIADTLVTGTGLVAAMPAGPVTRELVAALRALRFETVALEARTCSSEAAVQLTKGAHAITLHECGTCTGNLIEIQVDHRRGCVARSSWKFVRAALANPRALVDRTFLPPEPALFSLRCGDSELVVDPKEVDADRLHQWWEELRACAVQLASPQVASATQIAPQCQMQVGDQQIDFFQREGSWLAKLEGGPVVVALDDTVAALLDITTLRFAPLTLILEERVYARRIQIRRRGWPEVRLLENTSLGDAWRADAAIPWSEKQSTQVADRLSVTLSSLRAESFSNLGTTGLGPPSIEITIDFEAALASEMRSYLVQIWPSASQCRVTVDRGPVAFVDPSLCSSMDAAIPR